MNKSIFLSNVHHAYAQTDGSYNYPNSFEGDLIRQAVLEIKELRAYHATRYNDGLNTAISLVKEGHCECSESLICGLEGSMVLELRDI